MKSQTIIIAEAGVNHNGDISIAKKLIDVACDAGADYVKFQSFKASKLVSPNARKADYQIENIGDSDNFQYKMLKNLELSDDDHNNLIDYCENKEIKFLSTAFDTEGIDYLDSLGVELIKIPSGEITNYPYLRAVSKKRKHVILSTGMASLKEIEKALNILLSFGTKKEHITILHCNTEYPTPLLDVNLKAMNTIGNTFGVKIGYSDHTLGIEVPIAAVAMGAKVIEKHFTLDRSLAGPDHKASLEPDELKQMVKLIRNIELALSGNGLKKPSKSEIRNKNIVRKSIHVKKNLTKGTILEEKDLISLRPGDGISSIDWQKVIGKKLLNDKSSYDKLKWKDLL